MSITDKLNTVICSDNCEALAAMPAECIRSGGRHNAMVNQTGGRK